jgi:GTP-binding protein
MVFTVTIAGRPNVGKSTLFNRMAKRRLALVSDMPGLTRDRRDAEIKIDGVDVLLMDTAGLEEASDGSIAARMRAQSERAMREADAILFVIDARAGVTPADETFAIEARDSGKPVILVVNKCEGRSGDAGVYDSYRLGLGEPVAISAEHAQGLSELYDRLAELAQASVRGHAEPEPEENADDGAADAEEGGLPARPIKTAIVGRPNAGKSTLVNALLGDDRMITGPEAGLTRDSIASKLIWDGREIELFDTAGLRRKSRVTAEPEQLAVGDALNAIRFAEIVVLVIDAGQPFEKQDLQIAELVASEGRALVIAVNKWDLVADKEGFARDLRAAAEKLLPQVKGVPLVMISALAGRGLDKLMEACFTIYARWNTRTSTAKLNRWFSEMLERHTPPAAGGRRIKLRYLTQSNARPPTFVTFCSRPDDLPDSYIRYLTNGLRESFDLEGVPIRFHLRKTRNPYADEKRKS